MAINPVTRRSVLFGSAAAAASLVFLPVSAASAASALEKDARLGSGSSLSSSDGRYRLIMQGDGNLVLYGPSGALWATGTGGAGNWAVMQGDGNLVVYTAGGRPLWGSGTDRLGPSSLQVQTDGNLVIYKDGYPTWARDAGALFHKLGSGSRLNAGASRVSLDRRYTLIMQGDGNLVLYGTAGAVWATGTSGSGNWAVMQGDGNLVVYTAAGRPLWASNTGGQPGGELYVQTDGNLVLYRNGRAIWDCHSDSGTRGGTAPTPGGGISAGLDGFMARYTGQHVSFFNNGSYQCVDLFNFYNRDVVHASFIPGSYAYQLWTSAPSSKYARIDRNTTPAKGDVAIYGPGLPYSGQAGHVGIVVREIDRNNILLFEQNHYGSTACGSHSISKAYLLGYLRPL